MKWLALQSIILAYTFLVAFAFLAGTLIFDKGSSIHALKAAGIGTLSSRIVETSIYIWLIMFLVGFIFSSIGLLLSTKVSVGATIGISIGLGIIIPITSMIGMFSKKDEYEKFKQSDFVETSKWSAHDAMSKLSKLLPAGSSLTTQVIDDMYNPGLKLSKLTMTSGKKDSYKHLWLFDLNYQLTRLSEYAYMPVIPERYKNALSGTRLIKRGVYKVSGSGLKGQGVIDAFNNQITKAWKSLEPIRKLTITKINSTIAKGNGGESTKLLWCDR